MTIDELRKEANKLGYNIIKKSYTIKLLPCTCGCNRRAHWFVSSADYRRILVCRRCGKKAYGMNDIDVRRSWNDLIKEEMKEMEKNNEN